MVANKYSTVIMTIVLFLLSPCATPLTFDFPSFRDIGNNSLSLEGDAFIDGKLLRLTKTAPEDSQIFSVGRATYTEPFLLHESATGNLSDFSTSFTFVIDSRNRSADGDGIAFFIAPQGTSLRNSSAGEGRLGLPFNSTLSNEYPYVAVEFDIFQSENTATGDRSYSDGHVGIDVSSLKSVATTPWRASMKEGQQSINSAKVYYSSGTKDLTVAFTTYDDLNGAQVISSLSCKVDLAKYLTDWVVVGFSAKTERTPITLYNIVSWNFTTTSLLDNDLSLVVPTPGLTSEVKPRKHKRHVAVLIGSIVGGFMLVGALGLGLFNSCKRKVTRESTDIHGLRRFSYGEIALATRNFAEGEKLGGDGGDGEFYRGFRYDMNSYVTVKRIFMGSMIRKENKSELKILSRFTHRNLMNLIGWCDEQGELLLVFEFTQKGTLDFCLRKADNLLIWEVRYKIAKDLASALLYLHQEWEQSVHRNIQSSNILLDSHLNAKLGNLLFTEILKESPTVSTIGTIGYLDPGYFLTGGTGKMSDVYSFGVVALEIASGRKPIGLNMSLVDWVRELYREGKLIEAADPKLHGDFDRKQMECLMVVGLWCTNCDTSFRPSISEAIQVLNSEAPLPLILSNDTTGSSSQRSTSESAIFSGDSANSLEWGQVIQLRISARSRWRRLSVTVRFLALLLLTRRRPGKLHLGSCQMPVSPTTRSLLPWRNVVGTGKGHDPYKLC